MESHDSEGIAGQLSLGILVDKVGGRGFCISESFLQRLGVSRRWIPSPGLLSTHHFIHAAARFSSSPWVSYVSSARTCPPASPRGISHPQSLKQRVGREALVVQAPRIEKGFWSTAAVGSGVAMPWGQLVPNPHTEFCNKSLEQWEEVLGERSIKNWSCCGPVGWYHPRGAHSRCPCIFEELCKGRGAVPWHLQHGEHCRLHHLQPGYYQQASEEPPWLHKAKIRCPRTEEGLGTAVPRLPKACWNMQQQPRRLCARTSSAGWIAA